MAEDYVFDKTVYYINNRSKHLEVYMPGATNRFVTVTGDVYRTGEIPNDQTAMTTLLDSLMKRNKQVQQNHFQHHSYLDDEAVIRHAEEASNGDKFKKLYAGEWEELYGSQSDADMAMLSILAFWCGCDEEQMDRIFRTTGLMRDKWDRKQAGTTYGKTDGGAAEEQGAGTQQYEKVCSGCPAQSESQETGAACTGTG